MKYGLSRMIKAWLSFRMPTLGGYRYTIENPVALVLKKKGTIKLSDGYMIEYNERNKQDIIVLVGLALGNGIRFGNHEIQWRLDQANGILETHQGIKFYIKSVTLLDETFLSQTHFAGFDLKGKIVVTVGAYIGDTPFIMLIMEQKYSVLNLIQTLTPWHWPISN